MEKQSPKLGLRSLPLILLLSAMSYVSVSYSEAWDFSIFVISGVTMIVMTAATSFQTFLVNLDGGRWGEGGNLKD